MRNRRVIVVRFGERLAAQRAAGEFKTWEECLFVEQLSLRLEELLADLGLAAYKLAVRVAGPDERRSRFFFGLELEQATCHGPLDKRSIVRVSAEQLAGSVAATLIAHRDTVLVHAVGDGEWERVISTDVPREWIPRPAFDDLVAIAIRHGLDVPKVVDAFVTLFKEGMHPDEIPDQVEAIVASQSEPIIGVRVGGMDGLVEENLSGEVRKRLFLETGLVFPPLKVTLDKHLAATECRLQLNRLRTVANHFDKLKPADTLVELLRNQGSIFTTMTAGDSALGRFAESFPMAVFNTIELYGTACVLRVLRQLIDEGVDIRDLRTILGAILGANGTLSACYELRAVVLPHEATFLPAVQSQEAGSETNGLVECVRAQLRDQICQASADSERFLREVRLPQTLETRLSKLDDNPLGEGETFGLLSAIARVVETRRIGTVLVVSSRNRRRLWELIRYEFPSVAVLSEGEISPYVKSYQAREIKAVDMLAS